MASDGDDDRNPSVVRHPRYAVLACLLLALVGGLAGLGLSHLYDIVRVNVLDVDLAHRIGYAGEITSTTPYPHPLGIGQSVWMVLMCGVIVGFLITYPATVLTRREVEDPNAIEFAFGTALAGAFAGFVVLSFDWVEVPHDDWNPTQQVIRFGFVWVPVVIAGIAAILLLVWWLTPGPADGHDDVLQEGTGVR